MNEPKDVERTGTPAVAVQRVVRCVCVNCQADPSKDSHVALFRINEKGIAGLWICRDCLDDMETFEGEPHYIHAPDCPSYCDYACNGEKGWDLASRVKQYLQAPNADIRRVSPDSAQLKS